MITRFFECQSHHLVEVSNDVGFRLLLSSTGASVMGIFCREQRMDAGPDLVGALNPNRFYFGKTIGPIAGRVEKGVYSIGKKHFKIPPNEKGNALHSSNLNYGELPFSYEVFKKNDGVEVVFSLAARESKSFPSSQKVRVAYFVPKDSLSFELSFEVELAKRMPLNLTNHLYFCLGEKEVGNLELQGDFDHVYDYSPSLIPLRRRELSSPFDFSKGMKMGERLGELAQENTHGYDHCFALREGTLTLSGERFPLRFETDAPGVQIYCAAKEAVGVALEMVSLPEAALLPQNEGKWRRKAKYCFIENGQQAKI